MTSQIFEASNLTGLFISNTQLLFPPSYIQSGAGNIGDSGPHGHDHVTQILKICWLHIRGVNPFHHITKMLDWIEIWWLWKLFEWRELIVISLTHLFGMIWAILTCCIILLEEAIYDATTTCSDTRQNESMLSWNFGTTIWMCQQWPDSSDQAKFFPVFYWAIHLC